MIDRFPYNLQLFPRFVIDELSATPGMVGLFAASVYSAGVRYDLGNKFLHNSTLSQYDLKLKFRGPITGRGKF